MAPSTAPPFPRVIFQSCAAAHAGCCAYVPGITSNEYPWSSPRAATCALVAFCRHDHVTKSTLGATADQPPDLYEQPPCIELVVSIFGLKYSRAD